MAVAKSAGGTEGRPTPISEGAKEGCHSTQYSEEPQALCTVEREIVKFRVAMGSATCDNVINPEELLGDAGLLSRISIFVRNVL